MAEMSDPKGASRVWRVHREISRARDRSAVGTIQAAHQRINAMAVSIAALLLRCVGALL